MTHRDVSAKPAPGRLLRIAIFWIAVAVFAGPAWAQSLERINVATPDRQSSAAAFSPLVSEDGRFVVFSSRGVGSGSPEVCSSLFIRDRLERTTERFMLASVATDSGLCECLKMSGVVATPDLRFLAFSSVSSVFDGGPSNSIEDVFVYDAVSRQLERVSLEAERMRASQGFEFPSISDDGRFVAFSSTVGTNSNGGAIIDLYVHDRQIGRTRRLNEDTQGARTGNVFSAALSPDGSVIAYGPASGGLVIEDLETGARELYDVGVDGLPIRGLFYSFALSANGRFVLSYSSASALLLDPPTPAPGNLPPFGLYVLDRENGEFERVDVSSEGVAANGLPSRPQISADGRFVAFDSQATNLAGRGRRRGAQVNVYLRDRTEGTTRVLSADARGRRRGGSRPALSRGAETVVFASDWHRFVPGDTNDVLDLFAVDRMSLE